MDPISRCQTPPALVSRFVGSTPTTPLKGECVIRHTRAPATPSPDTDTYERCIASPELFAAMLTADWVKDEAKESLVHMFITDPRWGTDPLPLVKTARIVFNGYKCPILWDAILESPMLQLVSCPALDHGRDLVLRTGKIVFHITDIIFPGPDEVFSTQTIHSLLNYLFRHGEANSLHLHDAIRRAAIQHGIMFNQRELFEWGLSHMIPAKDLRTAKLMNWI